MTLRVRDIDAEWMDKARTVNSTAAAMARALAVAIPALQEHESHCIRCNGIRRWYDDVRHLAWRRCTRCDGTGANPARRALDTVIGEES